MGSMVNTIWKRMSLFLSKRWGNLYYRNNTDCEHVTRFLSVMLLLLESNNHVAALEDF